jgi:hypothetical protein
MTESALRCCLRISCESCGSVVCDFASRQAFNKIGIPLTVN